MKDTDVLHVAIVQSDLVWENPTENRKLFEQKINKITQPIDLVVLPEMFTTGFTMNLSLAEKMDGKSVTWMQKIAKKHQIALAGSIIISDKNKFYNRMLFVHPSGIVEHYNKRHLFTLAQENQFFTAGNERKIVRYKNWKICLQICYDLRFPVWSRNNKNYDVLLYIASWPKPRINAWNTLLKARAIENMAYVIGVNRVGKDAKGATYSGNSIIIDAMGNPLTNLKENEIATTFASLQKYRQNKLRNKFRFLEDRDVFTVQDSE